MSSFASLLAQTGSVSFEFGRIQDPVDWLLPILALFALLIFSWLIYIRDTVETSTPVAVFLLGLRMLAFLALFWVFLDPRWRIESESKQNSRVLVLVDTSLSMGLNDNDSGSVVSGPNRAERVVTALDNDGLVAGLRKAHDLVVLRFDEQLKRVVSLDRLPMANPEEPEAAATLAAATRPGQTAKPDPALSKRFIRWFLAPHLVLAVIAGIAGIFWHNRGVRLGLFAVAIVLLVHAGAVSGLAVWAQSTKPVAKRPPPVEEEKPPEIKVDWVKELEPRGYETRLGEALRDVINDNRSAPLAAVVLFTDGQSNVGIEPESAINVAQEAKVPVYTVGIGSTRPMVNARVANFVAPPRAHRGDDFEVTGYVHGRGLDGVVVPVDLISRPATSKPGNDEHVEETQEVVLGAEGVMVPVRFKLAADELGRRTLILKLRAPKEDLNDKDNQREVDVDVVDRKTRVLLLAGGPSREYQFLRNQLYRDQEVQVDVFLQSAEPGVSQEADTILDRFPTTAAELAEYDCIVGFDPDWQHLNFPTQHDGGPQERIQAWKRLNREQISLLEKWVAEQSGGLILIAGPVMTQEWTHDPDMETVKDLYPVIFHPRYLDSDRFGNREAWPIEFTREGLEAEFLYLEDDPLASRQDWDEFEGVYGYYSVKGAKPGATVYGRFSDPRASDGDSQPVYMAGQFYGTGRVFYMGSGEMWRLRALDVGYFERFYTKLIRHVSQGRLVRGSKRGVLLVERDRYVLGDTVAVRAQLSNSELKPLEVESVSMEVIAPDGTLSRVTLMPSEGRPGAYQGQFAVRQEGGYRVELEVPNAPEEDVLSHRIQVSVPDRERENPQRNDALLNEIAKSTGAAYFQGTERVPELVEKLPAQPRITFLTAAPVPLWQNFFTLSILCAVLCVEWLIRKLVKLA